nr:uncharacterized protein LOC120968112 isoform X2 [Aegilops tauschii subsp. strangulata]
MLYCWAEMMVFSNDYGGLRRRSTVRDACGCCTKRARLLTSRSSRNGSTPCKHNLMHLHVGLNLVWLLICSNVGFLYGFILISLGLLMQNFAKLFHTMEVSMSSLDEAATKFLLGEGHEESNMRSWYLYNFLYVIL